jgi:excinuclease ABC subunit A
MEGGELVYSGDGIVSAADAARKQKDNPHALTLEYLSGKKKIEVPQERRTFDHTLKIRRATQHNLKKIDVEIPLGVFCCVTWRFWLRQVYPDSLCPPRQSPP